MKRLILIAIILIPLLGNAQQEKKKRLEFARTYFELGGNYFSSFDGGGHVDGTFTSIEHSATFNPYLNWGGFHFWGHAEFYVTFPLSQFELSSNDVGKHQFNHYVVTGGRYLPWAYQPGKVRPYIGMSWSSLEFQQTMEGQEDTPKMSKDLLLTPDLGLLYGHGNITARVGLNYFRQNKWDYWISPNESVTIKTPKLGLMVGLIYSFDQSYDENPKVNERWNSYPTISKVGYDPATFGDFFVGIGPSSSFSLKKSAYNQSRFPYLADQLTSGNYFDIAIGYQLNTLGMFAALSYRNPEFKTSGYGTEQSIKKSSISFEINKYLIDYTGFAPFVGINIAYDRLNYEEKTSDSNQSLQFMGTEPGLSFGWDIIPGKTDEFLILRTNLRWYPKSSFSVDGMKFRFDQLEYNLIQVVFYPGRFIRSRA
jgi:hypothetical protein